FRADRAHQARRAARPWRAFAGGACMSLEISNVTKIFHSQRRGMLAGGESFTALDDVSLSVAKGASFGLVGESGSGKTTLTRCILRLEQLTSGTIRFDGQDMHALTAAEMRRMRSRM